MNRSDVFWTASPTATQSKPSVRTVSPSQLMGPDERAQAGQGEPGTWMYLPSNSHLTTSKPLPGTSWAARPCAFPAITKAGWTSVHAASSTSQEAAPFATPSTAPAKGEGGIRRAPGAPPVSPPYCGAPEPGEPSAWRRAAGWGGHTGVPQLSGPAAPPHESARTACTSRAGRRGLSGRAAGALRESPRPRLCLAASRPATSPCGDTQLPTPLPHLPRQAAVQLAPARHCEWVSPRLLPPSRTVEPARNTRKGAMAAPSGDCQLQWSISALPSLSAAQRPPSRGGRGAAGEAGGNVYKQDRGVEGPGGRRGAEPAFGAAAEPMGPRGARRKGGGGARGTFSARRPPRLAGARGQWARGPGREGARAPEEEPLPAALPPPPAGPFSLSRPRSAPLGSAGLGAAPRCRAGRAAGARGRGGARTWAGSERRGREAVVRVPP